MSFTENKDCIKGVWNKNIFDEKSILFFTELWEYEIKEYPRKQTDTLKYFVAISHRKLNIIYSSIWENKYFDDVETAKEFCNTFEYKKHKCLGSDI
jgi:hypothetical protein